MKQKYHVPRYFQPHIYYIITGFRKCVNVLKYQWNSGKKKAIETLCEHTYNNIGRFCFRDDPSLCRKFLIGLTGLIVYEQYLLTVIFYFLPFDNKRVKVTDEDTRPCFHLTILSERRQLKTEKKGKK